MCRREGSGDDVRTGWRVAVSDESSGVSHRGVDRNERDIAWRDQALAGKNLDPRVCHGMAGDTRDCFTKCGARRGRFGAEKVRCAAREIPSSMVLE
jgi:hypothetical protein